MHRNLKLNCSCQRAADGICQRNVLAWDGSMEGGGADTQATYQCIARRLPESIDDESTQEGTYLRSMNWRAFPE